MKILWALEPFHQDSKKLKKMYNLILQFIGPERKSGENLKIGFISTGAENELALAFDVPIKDRFQLYPRQLIKKILQKAKIIIEDKNIYVEYFETLSIAKAVDRLLLHAQKEGAQLLALSSHSRRGIKRFVLGSFAETIIHRSKKNLLIVNPATVFSDKIKNIFYSSDMSPLDQKHRSRVIDLALQLNADLTIFHMPKLSYIWSFEKESNLQYKKRLLKMCNEIKKECQKKKVKCNIILPKEIQPISELAVKMAKKNKADLIVVSAKSGPMTALMGGSVARQIVRLAHKPILILK